MTQVLTFAWLKIFRKENLQQNKLVSHEELGMLTNNSSQKYNMYLQQLFATCKSMMLFTIL